MALQEGPSVDARRSVALEEHLVAGAPLVPAAEEVVEADLVEAGGRGVWGDVAADPDVGPVRPGHHHRRVPPDEGPDAPLNVFVAGKVRLLSRCNGVDVVGAHRL